MNAIQRDPALFQSVEDQEIVPVRDLLLVVGGQAERESLLREALRKWRKDSASRVRWGKVRELLWEEPISLQRFREQLRAARNRWQAQQTEQRRLEQAHRSEERRQHEELRARLLAAFPTWQHAGRAISWCSCTSDRLTAARLISAPSPQRGGDGLVLSAAAPARFRGLRSPESGRRALQSADRRGTYRG